MKIDVFEPISVEIENDYDLKKHEEVNTVIVYVGDIEIYRMDAGYIPLSDYDKEEYIEHAKTRALAPLARFLKIGIEGL